MCIRDRLLIASFIVVEDALSTRFVLSINIPTICILDWSQDGSKVNSKQTVSVSPFTNELEVKGAPVKDGATPLATCL